MALQASFFPSSSSSSSFSHEWPYHVFLSFRGSDTRHGFAGNLYKALSDKGIRTFFDDQELQGGEEITPSLVKAIQDSRIAIVVFSLNYASSSFCLHELATIMECVKGKGRSVLPVFYDVDPCDVRHQKGSYGEAMSEHEERFKDEKETMQKWRGALRQAANLSGIDFKLGNEYEYVCIEKIVKVISDKISLVPLHIADYPIGLESRVLEVNSIQNDGFDCGVRMVGISHQDQVDQPLPQLQPFPHHQLDQPISHHQPFLHHQLDQTFPYHELFSHHQPDQPFPHHQPDQPFQQYHPFPIYEPFSQYQSFQQYQPFPVPLPPPHQQEVLAPLPVTDNDPDQWLNLSGNNQQSSLVQSRHSVEPPRMSLDARGSQRGSRSILSRGRRSVDSSGIGKFRMNSSYNIDVVQSAPRCDFDLNVQTSEPSVQEDVYRPIAEEMQPQSILSPVDQWMTSMTQLAHTEHGMGFEATSTSGGVAEPKSKSVGDDDGGRDEEGRDRRRRSNSPGTHWLKGVGSGLREKIWPPSRLSISKKKPPKGK